MQPNYRRCVSCRRVGPKTDFWRVVRVYPDRSVRLGNGMGRSAYLCPRADCLRQAQKKSRLGRALKVNVPEEIYQSLWNQLDGPAADAAPVIDRPPALPVLTESTEEKNVSSGDLTKNFCN